MADCIFCKIIQGEIPSKIIYESPHVLVIEDIKPAAPTHLLAIPKKHIANICDPGLIDGELSAAIFGGIQAAAAKVGLTKNGFRVVVNYGNDAGEAVYHLHFHILGGRVLNWPPG